MIEISTEAKGEIMEHANKAYEHLGKMLESLEEACEQGSMGERMGYREDDEWYIRRGNRDYDRMGERRGVRGTGRYGMRGGYRDPYYE